MPLIEYNKPRLKTTIHSIPFHSIPFQIPKIYCLKNSTKPYGMEWNGMVWNGMDREMVWIVESPDQPTSTHLMKPGQHFI